MGGAHDRLGAVLGAEFLGRSVEMHDDGGDGAVDDPEISLAERPSAE